MSTSAPCCLARLELLGARRRRDDARAHALADLHRGEPDAAGGAEHEQRLARPGAARDRAARGASCRTPSTDTTRSRSRRPSGHGHDLRRVGRRASRRCPPYGPNATTRSPDAHALRRPARPPRRRRPPRRPGENGGGGLNWYLPWTTSTSGKVDAARAHADEHLPGDAARDRARPRATSDSTGPYARQTSAFIVESHLGSGCAFGAHAHAELVLPLLVGGEVAAHVGVVPQLDLHGEPLRRSGRRR